MPDLIENVSKDSPYENPTCPICEIHRKALTDREWIAWDENWVLRLAPSEKNLPGYLYLEPRRHIESYQDLGELYTSLGVWIQKGMDWMHSNYQPRKVYLVTIAEAVPHLHFHLVPHYGFETKGADYIRLVLSQGLPAVDSQI